MLSEGFKAYYSPEEWMAKPLIEKLWDELMAIYERLESNGAPDPDPAMSVGAAIDAGQEYGEKRGRAQGIAFAIAMLRDSRQPNVEAIREEAQDRWEKSQ